MRRIWRASRNETTSIAASAGSMKMICRVAKWKLSRPMRSATAGLPRRTARCRGPSATGTPPGTSGRPSTTSWRPDSCRRGSASVHPSDRLNAVDSRDGRPEGFAAYLEILELVEACAGRRQQHGRLRRPRRAPRRRRRARRRRPACRKSRRARPRRASPRRPAPPRRSDRPWRCAGNRPLSGSMPPSLGRPPAIQ